jgi:hypothetical protein
MMPSLKRGLPLQSDKSGIWIIDQPNHFFLSLQTAIPLDIIILDLGLTQSEHPLYFFKDK